MGSRTYPLASPLFLTVPVLYKAQVSISKPAFDRQKKTNTLFLLFRLKDLLFPTLLAACHENKFNLNILKQEMSPDILVEYTRQILDKDDPGATSRESFWSPLLCCTNHVILDARTIAYKFSKAQWTDFLKFLNENHGTSTGSKAQ